MLGLAYFDVILFLHFLQWLGTRLQRDQTSDREKQSVRLIPHPNGMIGGLWHPGTDCCQISPPYAAEPFHRHALVGLSVWVVTQVPAVRPHLCKIRRPTLPPERIFSHASR